MTSLIPQITSLEAQLSSVAPIFATATVKQTFVEASRSIEYIQASISVLSNQEILATATATAVIDSASAGIAEANSLLSSYYSDDNLYGNSPSFGGNLAMTIVMAIFFSTHSTLALLYRSWWFGVAYFCGTGLEFAGYIGRTLSAHDPYNVDYFLLQFISLTLAPVFIMAGIYFLLAQLIIIYGRKFALLKPMWYSYIFITCDVISLVIQAVGGGMAAESVKAYENADSGTHVMVGGLAFQVFSMSIFLILIAHFLYRIRYFQPSKAAEIQSSFEPEFAEIRSRPLFKYFPIVVVIGVIWVYIRCIYRVIELAEGWDGNLITHEIYFMILDALMMSLTIVLFIPFHPGPVYGKGANVSMKHKRPSDDDEEQSSADGTEKTYNGNDVATS